MANNHSSKALWKCLVFTLQLEPFQFTNISENNNYLSCILIHCQRKQSNLSMLNFETLIKKLESLYFGKVTNCYSIFLFNTCTKFAIVIQLNQETKAEIQICRVFSVFPFLFLFFVNIYFFMEFLHILPSQEDQIC